MKKDKKARRQMRPATGNQASASTGQKNQKVQEAEEVRPACFRASGMAHYGSCGFVDCQAWFQFQLLQQQQLLRLPAHCMVTLKLLSSFEDCGHAAAAVAEHCVSRSGHLSGCAVG